MLCRPEVADSTKALEKMTENANAIEKTYLRRCDLFFNFPKKCLLTKQHTVSKFLLTLVKESHQIVSLNNNDRLITIHEIKLGKKIEKQTL